MIGAPCIGHTLVDSTTWPPSELQEINLIDDLMKEGSNLPIGELNLGVKDGRGDGIHHFGNMIQSRKTF